MYNSHVSAHMVFIVIRIITGLLGNDCEIRDVLFSSPVKYSE